MPFSSREVDILKTLRTQLQQITIANGYNTDAGERVYLLRDAPDEESDTFPLIIVNYKIDTQNSAEVDHAQFMTVAIWLYGRLSGIYPPDPLEPLELCGQLVRDAQNAVNLAFISNYVGEARPLGNFPEPVRDGSRIVAAQQRFLIPFEDQFGVGSPFDL